MPTIGLLILILASCAKSSQVSDNDLQGIWKAKKALYYMEGKEKVILPDKSDDSGLLGSATNPSVLNFTKYKEVLIGPLSKTSDGDESKVYSYALSGDSIKFTPRIPVRNIYKIGSDTLVTVHSLNSKFTSNYVDGKIILTIFYTR